jgi:hypothetical protein
VALVLAGRERDREVDLDGDVVGVAHADLRGRGGVGGEVDLDVVQQVRGGPRGERVGRELVADVGDDDEVDAARGHAVGAQALDLVDLRERVQDQALVVPRGQRALAVAQALADAGVELLGALGRAPAGGGVGLLDAGDAGVGLDEAGDALDRQRGVVVGRGVVAVVEAEEHGLGAHVDGVAHAPGVVGDGGAQPGEVAGQAGARGDARAG